MNSPLDQLHLRGRILKRRRKCVLLILFTLVFDIYRSNMLECYEKEAEEES